MGVEWVLEGHGENGVKLIFESKLRVPLCPLYYGDGGFEDVLNEHNFKHRLLLMMVYASGLRAGEVVKIRRKAALFCHTFTGRRYGHSLHTRTTGARIANHHRTLYPCCTAQNSVYTKPFRHYRQRGLLGSQPETNLKHQPKKASKAVYSCS